MAKRLVAKVGTYEKDGETKGEYVRIGVILSNDNGEYALLDPTVNLAGVMMKQRMMDPTKKGDMVMCGVFSDDRPIMPQQQQQKQQHQPDGMNDFEDDIPF